MNKDDLKQLDETLAKRQQEILVQLREFAKENPAVKGDFEVQIKDLGRDEYDNALEEADLGRDFALGQQLEAELRDINTVREKIKNGTYGACNECYKPIDGKRIKAMPVASLCISCARKKR